MTPKSWLAGALLFALGLACPAVHAQADSRLGDVRQAYAAVDYENTYALARAAIEQGGNDRAATAELYFLCAIAAAALDQADEARNAFSVALVVDPDLKVDRSLSPKIRAPYQEARGSLSTADGRPALAVQVRRRDGKLELALRDTQRLVTSVDLYTRVEGRGFAHRHFDAAPSRQLSVPAQSVQFFVRLLDRHGNVLLQRGREESPEQLPVAASSATDPTRPARREIDVNRAAYYVTAAALGAAGLASGGLSAAMYLRREEAAREWNGPDCEKPGASRAEQCAKVDDRRRSAEHLSIGFGAASGALLVGGVVTWLLAPSSRRASVSLETTTQGALLGLRGTL